MCEMCKGKTLQQTVDELHVQVLVDGFAIVGVEHPTTSWAYTVGLIALGYPELVVAGAKLASASSLLTELGRMICEDPVAALWTTFEVNGTALAMEQVHPSRLEAGLMAVWSAYDEAFDLGGRLRARQVRLPS